MSGPAPAVAPRPPSKPKPKPWRIWVRTLHIYASLVGLALALFFGATGFVLNHEDWFLAKAEPVVSEGRLSEGVLQGLEPLAVVEALRAEQGVAGALSSYEEDSEELRLRFSRPGEDTDVVISRADGSLRIERERGGLAAALTDLHKGKRSGALGKLLVDATSILLISISLSGFVLWLTLPKRRRLGLFALLLTCGLLGVCGVYIFG